MRCAVDLHIHSCLSPCGDQEMTPNNIANMAAIKGLHLIAVSDHNSALTLPAVQAAARRVGVHLLPAMELTTREEVHLLAYFRDVDSALRFSDEVYAHLPDIPNRPDIFGEQQVMDEWDEPVRVEKKLLISALDLGIDEVTRRIRAAGGAAVPAHINRGANGILGALGFVPPGAGFAALEVSRDLPLPERGLPVLPHLHSSDAHRLQDILEPIEFLDLPEPTAGSFLTWLARYATF